MDNDLCAFEDLVEWFEKKNDPWFLEKRTAKMRLLQRMQSIFCPCKSIADTMFRMPAIFNARIISCMKRANLISPYTAKGTTIIKGDVHINVPPIHIDACVCADVGNEKYNLRCSR